MEEIEFSSYGIKVLRRNDKLFIRFDGGGVVVEFFDIEISEAEAKLAKKSGKDAASLILRCQRENRPSSKVPD